jgi:hypothetical protein
MYVPSRLCVAAILLGLVSPWQCTGRRAPPSGLDLGSSDRAVVDDGAAPDRRDDHRPDRREPDARRPDGPRPDQHPDAIALDRPLPDARPPDQALPDCQLVTYYKDSDGDGWGSPSTTKACTKPSGYVSQAGDCYDASVDAHPGQLGFFSSERGDGSFDYNCDGVEELESDHLSPEYVLCAYGQCSVAVGWIGKVPPCGQAGTWLEKCDPAACVGLSEVRTQACR